MDPLGFPTTLPEFQRVFPDDRACATYLEHLRWADGFARGRSQWQKTGKPSPRRRLTSLAVVRMFRVWAERVSAPTQAHQGPTKEPHDHHRQIRLDVLLLPRPDLCREQDRVEQGQPGAPRRVLGRHDDSHGSDPPQLHGAALVRRPAHRMLVRLRRGDDQAQRLLDLQARRALTRGSRSGPSRGDPERGNRAVNRRPP